MKRFLFICQLLAITFGGFTQTVIDVDGNSYNTLTIGTQVWLKENLKATKFNDGSKITSIKTATDWKTAASPAYCWYNNDSVAYKNTYGALYNWYTINSNKLCPLDWHVPSDAEWNTMADFLGGKSIAGSKLKEAGSSHWTTFNTNANNSSGFTALPGGYRDGSDGSYGFISNYGSWWSTSAFNVNLMIAWSLFDNEASISQEYQAKSVGHYVRCLKDLSTAVGNISIHNEVQIYPNPTCYKLFISGYQEKNTLAVIYDLQGKQVINKILDANDIDVSMLSSGAYLLKLVSSDQTKSFKWIKK